MSERKVLNKYYPPDFDPSNVPRLKLPKTRQYTVRVMTPCNMKCNTCGDYIAKAKKFNARKETVDGEEYLGLKIFRFYIKCPCCMAEITFRTDPKAGDYEVEHGATRNFQAWRLAQMAAEKEKKDADEDEKLNPMKMLENRTKASKKEMQELEDLEELRELSNKTVKLDTDDFLKREQERREKFSLMQQEMEEQEDEDTLNEMLKQQNQKLFSNYDGTIEGEEEELIEQVETALQGPSSSMTSKPNVPPEDDPFQSTSVPSVKEKMKRKFSSLVKVKSTTTTSLGDKKVKPIEGDVSKSSPSPSLVVLKSSLSLLSSAYGDSDSD